MSRTARFFGQALSSELHANGLHQFLDDKKYWLFVKGSAGAAHSHWRLVDRFTLIGVETQHLFETVS